MNQEILDIENYNPRTRDLQSASLWSKKTTGWSEDDSEKNLTVLELNDTEIGDENSVLALGDKHGAIRLSTKQAILSDEEVVVSKQTITLSVEDAERLIEQLQRAVKNA